MAMVFPTSPTVGQLFTEAGRSWVWTGSSWDAPTTNNALQIPFGMELIASTSFVSQTTLTFANVFTSQYENYKILFRGTQSVAGTSLALQFSQNGTPTTGVYNYTYGYLAGSFAAQQRLSAGTANQIIISSDGIFGIKFGEINVFAPQLATQTLLTAWGGSNVGIMTFASGDATSGTQFDGFTLFPSSGSFTGTISIYGMRK